MTWAAASIWIVGKIGTAVGWGYIDIAIILAAANLAIFKFRAPIQSVQLRGHQSELRRLAHARRDARAFSSWYAYPACPTYPCRPSGFLL